MLLLLSSSFTVWYYTFSIKSPAVLEFDLETIYMDVGKKLDALLQANRCLSETDPIIEEAKDYLKIVHSIINVRFFWHI